MCLVMVDITEHKWFFVKEIPMGFVVNTKCGRLVYPDWINLVGRTPSKGYHIIIVDILIIITNSNTGLMQIATV